MDLVSFRQDFEYKPQRRKKPAKSVWNQWDIAGADFETKNGYPHILTWTLWNREENAWKDFHWIFGGTEEEPTMFLDANGGKERPAFNIQRLCYAFFQTGKPSQGGWGTRRKPQEMYFFNLQYDAQAIIKTLPKGIIERLFNGDTLIVDTKTWDIETRVERVSMKNPRWKKNSPKSVKKKIKPWRIWNEDKTHHRRIEFNRYIKVGYLPKKWLGLEPLEHYSQGVKWGKVDCWDIKPFCGGGSLNFNSNKYLGEKKIDFSNDEMNLLGSLSPEGVQFTLDNWDKIIDYAEKDSNLTARLAWKIIQSFEREGVRMSRPYSPASVAERAALDLCEIPTMNDVMDAHLNDALASWTSYQGGHFESTGCGWVDSCEAWDITSAYPHVMWWLPDISKGDWIGSLSGDDGVKDYLARGWRPYSLSSFEAEVIFPPGLDIYPAAKKSERAGCLMNPRIVYGFFTGDEIKEFENWNAEINIERWSAFIPLEDNEAADDVEDGIKYPFRPFIKTFYGGKLAQDQLKIAKSPNYDPQKRAIYKLMINSLYGKTCATPGQPNEEGKKKTGQLWNPSYASVITAGCRIRMAEIIRVNDFKGVLSVATDGIIFERLEGHSITVPENPKPVYFDGERVNLGDWDFDGEGSLLLMMSGVYSMVKESIKNIVKVDPMADSKNTFRGSYSLFLDRRDEKNNLLQDLYGEDWLTFCQRHENLSRVERTEEINPTMRPYSLGEAKVRNDYTLVNQFRVVNVSISPNGDSNKRRWEYQPQTFGELMSQWWPSYTWEVIA
jgi:hypothetical protein